ncbi:MAG: hypothetical protein COV76_03700 [Candidatus Omnitrophica bacterium CG11_big_fil_rev_8_21_14_0_20_64_10]|nr:MAG: hypothetical protein COV76_03700 [Candidatus Omnitrophica bacterium CG11_big_fil_rev_8_21_14_0_20_64_10]
MNKTIGLIAGNRAFPIHVARAARRRGWLVAAVGLREETDPALESEVDRMHWVTLSELGGIPDWLKGAGVREVILAGQIQARRLVQSGQSFDPATRQLLARLPDRSGDSAMKLAVRVLQSKGFRVLHSAFLLKEWIPVRGDLTRLIPMADQRKELRSGLRLARKLAAWGVGQTLILKQGAVAAVEGMEGTDETIERAGRIAGPGCVVVKACGRGKDMRFDIPVVGEETLRRLAAVQAAGIGVEAGRTLLFDRPALIALADRLGLFVTAL